MALGRVNPRSTPKRAGGPGAAAHPPRVGIARVVDCTAMRRPLGWAFPRRGHPDGNAPGSPGRPGGALSAARAAEAAAASSRGREATRGAAEAPTAPQPALRIDDAVFPPPRVRASSDREYGALEKDQYSQFVQFFRQASPYIEGHRGRTFVVAIGSEAFQREEHLQSLLVDVTLLHGLGVRLVLVLDAEPPAGPGPAPVVSPEDLDRSVHAAGLARMEVEGHLSKGLAVSLVRRHGGLGSAPGGGWGVDWGGGTNGAAAAHAAGRASDGLTPPRPRSGYGGAAAESPGPSSRGGGGGGGGGAGIGGGLFDRSGRGVYNVEGGAAPAGQPGVPALPLAAGAFGDASPAYRGPPSSWQHATFGPAGGPWAPPPSSQAGLPALSHGPAVSVVSGNYVVARRRGVVNGVDLGHRGSVRAVLAKPIRRQLAAGSVVLLTALGYSASGETLRCDAHAVALRAAADLRADKLVLVADVAALAAACGRDRLPDWLPLPGAEVLLNDSILRASAPWGRGEATAGDGAGGDGDWPAGGARSESAGQERGAEEAVGATSPTGLLASPPPGAADDRAPPPSTTLPPLDAGPPELERWVEAGAPAALLAATAACRAGVKRAHIVDAGLDGGLLLELYTRDGAGCMVSADLHEGIRRAMPVDVAGIKALLAPLEQRGFLVVRDLETLRAEIDSFAVWQRSGRILGCVATRDLGRDDAGRRVAEIAAFAVHPDMRGLGKGDSLLEYAEETARKRGVTRFVLLTTRTADWFSARGFRHAGPAYGNPDLPAGRRAKVDPKRNSMLYRKDV